MLGEGPADDINDSVGATVKRKVNIKFRVCFIMVIVVIYLLKQWKCSEPITKCKLSFTILPRNDAK